MIDLQEMTGERLISVLELGVDLRGISRWLLLRLTLYAAVGWVLFSEEPIHTYVVLRCGTQAIWRRHQLIRLFYCQLCWHGAFLCAVCLEGKQTTQILLGMWIHFLRMSLLLIWYLWAWERWRWAGWPLLNYSMDFILTAAGSVVRGSAGQIMLMLAGVPTVIGENMGTYAMVNVSAAAVWMGATYARQNRKRRVA